MNKINVVIGKFQPLTYNHLDFLRKIFYNNNDLCIVFLLEKNHPINKDAFHEVDFIKQEIYNMLTKQGFKLDRVMFVRLGSKFPTEQDIFLEIKEWVKFWKKDQKEIKFWVSAHNKEFIEELQKENFDITFQYNDDISKKSLSQKKLRELILYSSKESKENQEIFSESIAWLVPKTTLKEIYSNLLQTD